MENKENTFFFKKNAQLSSENYHDHSLHNSPRKDNGFE